MSELLDAAKTDLLPHVTVVSTFAIRDAGLHTQFTIELRTSMDNKIPLFAFGAVVTKNPVAAPGT